MPEPPDPSAPSVRQALRAAEARLAATGLATAPLDARVLLRHILGLTSAGLYLHLDDALPTPVASMLAGLVERRAQGEPVAYLTGQREFYGLTLRVTPDVLIPQPDTELLVERAVALAPPRVRVVDMGAGSGAIAVAVAAARPDLHPVAVDRSFAACRVARSNVVALGLTGSVTVICADLLTATPGPWDVVLANLPYLSDAEMATLHAEVRWEPAPALQGGADGLDLYRRLFAALAEQPAPTLLLCEIGPLQASAIRTLAERAFPHHHVQLLTDLAGRERVVEVHRRRVATLADEASVPVCCGHGTR